MAFFRFIAIVVVFAACQAPTTCSAQQANFLESIQAYAKHNGHEILRSLKTIVEMPNVSSDQAAIRKVADYLVDQFTARDAKMELLEVAGANPVVFGEIRVPNATRTIMIYVHFDGQPVNAAKWKSTQPFQPRLYSRAIENGGRPIDWPQDGQVIDPQWRIYGRSTSDDKAPFVALLTALDLIKASDISLTSNIRFFFDGEEEIGSPNMRKVLERHAEKFEDVDLWIFCDGPLHQSRRPTLYFGVRGVTGFEITVYGATRNLHSGHYGNWAPNPGLMLSHLLASMKDQDGNVVIKDFYQSVTPLTKAERDALAAVPKIDDDLRFELGLVETENQNQAYLERMQLPSLNVKGIECGTVGAKARNIVPNQAAVAIDIRLVKGNRPRQMIDLVKDHVAGQGFTIVDEEPVLKTRRENRKIARITTTFFGYPAARTAMDHAQVVPLIHRLGELVGDDQLLQVPSLGGSLPLYLITDYLNQPLVIMPIANHDNNQHAPDENLRVGNLMYGIKAMAAVLTMEQ